MTRPARLFLNDVAPRDGFQNEKTTFVACARTLPGLVGHDIPSQTAKAGRRLELHALPPSFNDIRERAHAR